MSAIGAYVSTLNLLYFSKITDKFNLSCDMFIILAQLIVDPALYFFSSVSLHGDPAYYVRAL